MTKAAPTHYIKNLLSNTPSDWLNLTTHRLDIYNESLAKKEFIEKFEALFQSNNSSSEAFEALPTAYDYIRLGHPLSSVLEWTIAQMLGIDAAGVISFSSTTTPILSVLRKNLLEKKQTRILYTQNLPPHFGFDL